MMLEQILAALQGLTAAVAANTAALAANPTKAAGKKAATTETPPAGATGQPTAVQTNQATIQTPAQNAAATPAPTDAVAVQAAQAAGAAMVRVANEISRDKAVEILGKYGAQVFAGVKPADYAAFQADCLAALKPAAAAPSGAAGLL